VTRHALPLAARHLHPCVSKALRSVERLSGRVGARSCEAACRDGRIAKYRNLDIFVLCTVVFGGFRGRQRLGLVGNFPIIPRIHELVGQQRGDQVGIVCL